MANRNGNRDSSGSSAGWGIALPAGLRQLAETPVSTLVTQALREFEVIVSINEVELRSFAEMQYQALWAKATALGGDVTVTADELFRLLATAIKARIAWTTFKRTEHRIDSFWCLTVPMHLVVSTIGVVEQGGSRYVPVWNEENDVYTLTVEERQEISNRLRGMEPLGFTFTYALPADKDGVAKVMLLLTGQEGSDVYFYSSGAPVHALEAIIASLLGITSQTFDPAVIPPQLLPQYKVGAVWAVSFLRDFVNRSVA
jgi:hypothetical protein